MKISLQITNERQTYTNFSHQPGKVETYTIAEVDAELTGPATVGFLRTLADSIEGRKDRG